MKKKIVLWVYKQWEIIYMSIQAVRNHVYEYTSNKKSFIWLYEQWEVIWAIRIKLFEQREKNLYEQKWQKFKRAISKYWKNLFTYPVPLEHNCFVSTKTK